MEDKFNKNANPQGAANGTAQGGKKSGIAWKVIIIIILGLLVISPVDLIPGDPFLPVAFVDDLAYVAGIIGTAVSMVKGRKNQQIPGAAGAQGYIPPMYNEVKSNKRK